MTNTQKFAIMMTAPKHQRAQMFLEMGASEAGEFSQYVTGEKSASRISLFNSMIR